MMMQMGGGSLPSAYQQVEYLKRSKSNLGAYILLDLTVSEGLNFETILSVETAPSGSSSRYDTTILGTDINWSNKGYSIGFSNMYIQYSNGFYFHMQYSVLDNRTFTNYFPTSNEFVKYKFENGNCYADDVLLVSGNNFADFGTISFSPKIAIFSLNRSGSIVNGTPTGDICIKSLRFYKNGQDVCNLIPCYRKSDYEPGLYDVVGMKFYSNVGTNQLEVGNDV